MKNLALRLGARAALRLPAAGRLNPGTVIFLLLTCLLAGCAAVGPRSIKAGRVVYAEAINQTQDEQILLSIVKGRYGESATLLAVNGVAANMRFRADMGVEAGFGGVPGDNLLIGGLAYEENPTITYAPVQGEDYVRELMSPVPLDFLLLVAQSTTPHARALPLLVNRINDLRNPDFLQGTNSEPDPRFTRLVELLAQLSDAGAFTLVESTDTEGAFDVWLEPRTPADNAIAAEILDLLSLHNRKQDAQEIVIPAYFGIRADEGFKIGLTTRSTFNLVEIMRAAVEVPKAHAAAGLTLIYPPPGLAGRSIRIQSSTRKPAGQALAVKYRGYWFWIDETDQETKAAFRLLRTLWSMSIAKAVNTVSPPLLTLPVGN